MKSTNALRSDGSMALRSAEKAGRGQYHKSWIKQQLLFPVRMQNMQVRSTLCVLGWVGCSGWQRWVSLFHALNDSLLLAHVHDSKPFSTRSCHTRIPGHYECRKKCLHVPLCALWTTLKFLFLWIWVFWSSSKVLTKRLVVLDVGTKDAYGACVCMYVLPLFTGTKCLLTSHSMWALLTP